MSIPSEPRWLPIRYFAFWDVPRALVVDRGGDTLVLECPWDEVADDYAEYFDVYAIAASCPPESSWQELMGSAALRGRVPVASVRFDQTRRRFVDASSLSF